MRNSLARLAALLAIALLSSSVFFVFVLESGVNRSNRATLSLMMEGKAHRPFVTRALVPMTVRFAGSLVPAVLRSRIDRTVADLRDVLPGVSVEEGKGTELVLLCVLLYGCLFAFALVFARFYAEFDSSPGFPRWIVPFVALAGLPPFFRFGYVYDPAALFLFTLCFLALARRRFGVYLVALGFAAWNKETAVLLVPFFAIHFRHRLPPGEFRRLLLLQGAVIAFVRVPLTLLYRGNPGGFVEVHVWEVLTTGLGAYSVESFVAWGGLAALLVRGWRARPPFLRDSLVILAALFGLFVLFGFPNELRVFLEVYPVVLALVLLSVSEWIRRGTTSFEASASAK